MTINCAIIDDEPLAAGLLKSYAEKTPFLHLTGTYGSAIEAMRELREHPVQLLFLDIQMPELSGTEFAKILPKETKVIFTTAFQQYASTRLSHETHLVRRLPEGRQQSPRLV